MVRVGSAEDEVFVWHGPAAAAGEMEWYQNRFNTKSLHGRNFFSPIGVPHLCRAGSLEAGVLSMAG